MILSKKCMTETCCGMWQCTESFMVRVAREEHDDCDYDWDGSTYDHGEPPHAHRQKSRRQPSEPKPKSNAVGGDAVNVSRDKNQNADNQPYYFSYGEISFDRHVYFSRCVCGFQ